MDFIVIGLVAFSASLLTFFSGFGLGTLLLPAFAFFFPASLAVAATGVVHLLNNLFKGGLVMKHTDWPTVLRFGLPAIPAAILGAFILTNIDQRIGGIIIGSILTIFAFLELQPWFQKINFPKKYIPIGGLLSGLMGGISGQQGALRSMFLLKSDFDAPRYIATGTFIAILIDLARLPTYAFGLSKLSTVITTHQFALIGVGTVLAFVGAWLGAKRLKKLTVGSVRYVITGLMFAIGLLLIFGIIGN